MKEQILNHIREVCNLKRLEFGCMVKVKNNSFPDGYTTIIRGLESCHAEDNTKAGRYLTTNFGAIEEGTYEIIGLPVELNHLFLAIEKNNQQGFIDFCVFLWRHNLQSSKDIGSYNDVPMYDLKKSVSENLDNPELCSLIAELLAIKSPTT